MEPLEELLAKIQSLNKESKYSDVIDLLSDKVLEEYKSPDLYIEKVRAYHNTKEKELRNKLTDIALNIDANNATIAAGIDLTNTSTSSNTIGTGSKSWTLATAKSYQIGQWVTLTDAGTPTNYALGQVTACNSGTKVLTVNVTVTSGSGTIASWTVQYSSPPDQTVNISGLTELTGLIASNDMLVIYVASAGANKKISMKTLELHFRSILGV